MAAKTPTDGKRDMVIVNLGGHCIFWTTNPGLPPAEERGRRHPRT
jgi:hypothetical protein